MSAEKPFIEQMTDMAKDARNNIPEMSDIKTGATSLGEGMNDMKQGMKNTLGDFSSKSVMNASSDFLESNSMVAKFGFIILVLVVFVVTMKVMVGIIGYFVTPSLNPYIIKGSMPGTDIATIEQDPSKSESIPVLRSNGQNTGMEFTWSTWLYLEVPTLLPISGASESLYQRVFVKGTTEKDTNNISLVNGPGMYIKSVKQDNNLSYSMMVVLDDIDGTTPMTQGDYTKNRNSVTINKLPTRKWFHVAVRLSNLTLDVYVNGTIAMRHMMDTIPKQNTKSILVGGFPGTISNLQYFAHALNVFEINNIVAGGPNINSSKKASANTALSGNYNYLGNSWYTSHY